MDGTTKEVNKTTKALHMGFYKLKQIGLGKRIFVDDVAIYANSEHKLQHNVNEWNK